MNTSEYRKEVTNKIIEMLESGDAPWQKPWDAGVGMINRPHNFNGRPYHGTNALLLWYVASKNGYEDPRWLTFNQVKKLGGHVNKGEKAQIVEYWQWSKQVENPETGEKETVELDRPYVYRAAVFNGSQCSGLPAHYMPEPKWNPHERAENIVIANGVPVYHNTVDRAYYTPTNDYVCLPPRAAFATEDAYYSTLLHEIGHSTGHPSRLNREQTGKFGSPDYAKEELRAELASAFLCAELGISMPGTDEQHAAYVKSWVGALKNDYNEIFRAAADADKICNYLYDREKEYLKQKEAGIAVNSDVIKAEGIEPEGVLPDAVLSRMTPEEFAEKDGDKMPDVENQLPREVVIVQMAQNAPMRGKVAFYINDKTYLGDKEYYGSNGLYDNSDNTLEYVSSNDHMFHFIVGREFAYSAESLLKREELDLKDFEEYQELKTNGVLAKYENIRYGDVSFEGKPFDEVMVQIQKENKMSDKESSKMAEEKSAMDNFDAKPATDAQKAYAMSLGLRFKDEITKDQLAERIGKRLEGLKKLEESLSKPATEKQLETLKENNLPIKEGMTIGDAKKLIDNLPVTAQQMVYMDRLKLDYDKNINRAEATKLITSKLNYLNKIEQRPASEAQVSLLDKRGIAHSENVTVAEFNEKIYFGKPTTKQINYLNLHRIEYDKEKICYGKARNLIDINKKYIAQRRELPATEKQIDYLKNNGIEYKEGITSGQASDIIDNHMTAAKEARQQGSNEPLTEKQKAFLEERGLPTDIGKKEAVQIIGRTMNMEKIQNFTEAKNVNKPTIYEEYRALAKKQIESGKEIDDKKIAAELLKRGHSEKYVQKAIFSCSPANDYNNSLKAVKAAAKMPTVKKAMEKSADRGR